MIVDFLAGKGVKKLAVIGQDNELGHAIRDGVKAEAAATGLEVVANETTEPNSTEVSSAVLKVRDAGPEAIVLGTDNTQSALVMKAVRELGWEPRIMGTSSTVTTGSAGTFGPAAGGGHVGTTGAKVAEWDGSAWKLVTDDWVLPGRPVS